MSIIVQLSSTSRTDNASGAETDGRRRGQTGNSSRRKYTKSTRHKALMELINQPFLICTDHKREMFWFAYPLAWQDPVLRAIDSPPA